MFKIKAIFILSYALATTQSWGIINLLGNYPINMPTGGQIIDENASESQSKAVLFQTPAQDYNIDSVTFRFTGFDLGDVPLVGFFTDNGALPGSLVESYLSNPAPNDGSGADFLFTPSSTITLTGSTQYWLVVAASSGEFTWRRNQPTQIPSGEATFLSYRTSGDNGATFNNSSTRNLFEIQATAVPEPSTYAFLLFFTAAIVAVRKSSQRRS